MGDSKAERLLPADRQEQVGCHPAYGALSQDPERVCRWAEGIHNPRPQSQDHDGVQLPLESALLLHPRERQHASVTVLPP